MDFYRRNYIEGLFLSSAIVSSPNYTMELLVQIVENLRYQDFLMNLLHGQQNMLFLFFWR